MIVRYGVWDLLLYLLIYAFVGWVSGVAVTALKDRRFVNHGFLNMPFALSEGITAVILLLVLPTLEGHPVMQYVLTCIVVFTINGLTEQFLKNITRRADMAKRRAQSVSPVISWTFGLLEALMYLLGYLLLHPFVLLAVNWMPDLLVTILAAALTVLVCCDYMGVYLAVKKGMPVPDALGARSHSQRIGDRVSQKIWKRLEKAYPGVERMEVENRSRFTFAEGLCFDKLVWVFLIACVLGAGIEMVYCRLVGGTWMNRSSLVYGPFSIVWGFGAVVLTVVLQRFAGKPDRVIFLVGFVVGGAYEYLCSVFTELVFGTVFWDYSYMPLNIGGRTNVLFCIFWGILSVIWVKMLYPPMDRGIEKLPPLLGKIATWIIVVAMLSNSLLTGGAMLRYNERQTNPDPDNVIERLLDERFDDAWVENRWPNMIVTE